MSWGCRPSAWPACTAALAEPAHPRPAEYPGGVALALGDPLPAELEVLDPSGDRHRLAGVCAGQTTLLVHLRHLG